MSNNWYPDRSHFRTHEEFDAHVQTLNIVYAHQAKLEETIRHMQNLAAKIPVLPPPAGGSTNTRIGGFNLVPGQPATGDTLRYDSTLNQFKFGA